jgi:diguanylate cyclase (GGDEF)-like protein/PAS domain S-box-containing protein
MGPSDRRRHRPSTSALSLAHELALVTGRLVTWSYDPRADEVWWSDPVGDAFDLALDDRERDGRWLLEPVLASLEASPWRYAEFELDRTVVDRDGQQVVLLIRARPVPSTGELSGVIADVTERRATETALRDLVDRYRLLVDLSPDAIVVHQMGIIRFVNPAGVDFVQLGGAEEAVGRPITDFVHPDSIADMLSRIGGLNEPGAVSETAEARLVRADGTELIVESTSVRTTWDGQPAFQVILRDVTERRAAEQRLAAVVDALDEGVIMADAAGRLMVVNQSARAMLGAAVLEATRGHDLLTRLQMVDERGVELPPELHPSAIALRTGVAQLNVVIGIDDAAGGRRWVSTNSQPLRLRGSPRVEGVVCSFNDITRQRQTDLQLMFQATHDPLTGLANRGVLLAELQRCLDGSVETGGNVGLLFIDVDRFKAVNDSLGHVSGDEFLKVVARRLLGVSARTDLVGRLAGDEFVVIVDCVDDVDEAMAFGRRVGQIISEPARLASGHTAAVTASIGVAVGNGATFDAEGLLRSADAAMYRAKQQGRCRVELYDEVLGARIRQRLDLQNELRAAIDRGDITVHYQPISDLVTGRHAGVEALARWPHEAFGWVPPEDFIPVAERSGLILPLGDLVLQKAVSEFAAWRAQRPQWSHLYLSVNVSNRQLTTYTVDLVRKVLEEAGLGADRLWLEITESALAIDPDSAGRVLNELRELGVHLAIDDFGTGYSSLLSLKRYPVELVKIDRSFIEGLGRDPDSDAIVTAVLRLAQSLNLATIAEGVETELQHRRLVERGCTLAQGYRLGQPSPLEALD